MGNASPRSSISYEQEGFVVKEPWALALGVNANSSLTDGLRAAKLWGCGIKYTGSNEILITHPLHHKRLIHSAHRKTSSIALVGYIRAVRKATLAKAGPCPMPVMSSAPVAGGLDPVERFRQMKMTVPAPEPKPEPVQEHVEHVNGQATTPPTIAPVKSFSGRSMAHSAIRQIDEMVYKYHYASAHTGTFRECSDPHCEGARAAFKTIKTMGLKLEATLSSKDENEALFIETSDENERLRGTISKLTDQINDLSAQLDKSTPKAPPSPGKVQLYATADGHGNVYALGNKLYDASGFPEESDNLDYRRTKYDLLLRGLRNVLDQIWVGEARSLTNFIDGMEMMIAESKYSLSFITHFKTLNFNALMPKLMTMRRPGGERNMIGPSAARIIRESLEKLRNG